MKDKMVLNGLKQNLSTRRDFLKISGLSVSALSMGQLINAPLGYAKNAKGIYPSKAIQYIVPKKPGGGYDIIARSTGPYITKYLRSLSPGVAGGGIVVRNEERKGYSILYNAKPDGYTIGIIDTSPYVDNLLGVVEVDFTKYTVLHAIASSTKEIVANKKGFNSWNEVFNAQKKDTVKMGVGFFARGNHVCAIIANEKLGTRFKLIPFRGTAECMAALLRGDVETALVSDDSAKPLIDAKEIKVLLSFSDTSEYPGTVNIKDLGHPELIDQISSHRIVVAPPNLEAEPKRLLLSAMKKTCEDPEFVAWANKAKCQIKRIYGADAEKFFMEYVKFYNDMAPLLKKQLS
jgi:tripartite-type tricarboxylate transporter receptor subunit TctC